MDVLITSTRWTLAAAGFICLACAVPGPPRPQHVEPLVCAEVEPVALSDEGLRLDLLIPEPRSTSGYHELLLMYRGVAGGEFELYQELDLVELAPEVASNGGRLSFLEAELFSGQIVRYALGVLPLSEMHCVPQRHALSIVLPTTSAEPAPVPVVEVLGLTARIEAPVRGQWRLYRRDVRERDQPALLMVSGWTGGEPYVDTTVEEGRIYAYAMAQEFPILVDALPDVLEPVVGVRGPEVYAPITPLEKRFGP